MKKIVIVMLAIFVAISGFAEDLKWQETFDNAQQAAKKEKKTIFLFFTGSDWCGWCKKLDSEILSQKQFIKYANQKLILYKADFPRNNKPLPAIASDNQRLAGKYQIRGYPTVILIDAEGKVLGKLGYMRGGPKPFINKINQYLK